MNQSAFPPGALSGLVVIDLTVMLAGPFATMLLADHGARVIKIEPPGGENTRVFGPFPPGGLRMEDGGYGAYFASTNRNKESVILDLKSEAGKAAFRRLVDKADVVIENFRAGVMERLGLSYESLIARNPKLVYASIRGFGDPRTGKSPLVDWPAYDVVSQAMGGIMGITGHKGGAPMKIGPGVGDIMPAMQSVIGILAACWHAQRTGQGQFVDVGMVDAVMSVCERMIYQYSYVGDVAGPEGSGHPLLCPYGIFEARDGWVAIGIPHDHFFKLFAELIGQPELADDPRYQRNADRIARRGEVEAIVTEWTLKHTKTEIAAVLGGTVPFGPVQTAEDIFENPHTAARGMLAEVEHPGAEKPVRLAGTAIKMDKTPGGVRHRAPLAGEHTRKVLAEFGFSGDEIRTLTGA
jgi:crotonobetainyl-CoA:carnitine CoA-transferase CaiB-like acyl-CoA transferase